MQLETQEQALTIEQEFSIEIPDKEADAIHSGMFQWQICDAVQHANFCYSHPSRGLHLPPARRYVFFQSNNHRIY